MKVIEEILVSMLCCNLLKSNIYMFWTVYSNGPSARREREREFYLTPVGPKWAYGGWCCIVESPSPACRSICRACLYAGLGRPSIYDILYNVTLSVVVQDNHDSFLNKPTKNAFYDPTSSSCTFFLWNSSVLGAHYANLFTPWVVPKISLVVSGLFAVLLNSLALYGLALAHGKGL